MWTTSHSRLSSLTWLSADVCISVSLKNAPKQVKIIAQQRIGHFGGKSNQMGRV